MAYYQPIYDPREEAYLAARSSEHQFIQTRVRATTILPNYARFTMARAGMYSNLNPVFNEICPPLQMDEDLFQQNQHMAPSYPHQYNSPAESHGQQQMPVVPYRGQPTNHREFSPGISGSSGDLRNMGVPSHVPNEGDRHFSPAPGSVISLANKPDMQWMVTTSHIDMRTVTPPNAVVSHSHLHQSPGMSRGQTLPAATANHSGYPVGTPSSSSAPTVGQKPRLTKSGKPRGTPGRKRKVEDHELSPEEAAKRGLRRERNKLAAAKCRNRRRELTDRLQGETDILEDHQGMLTQEIIALQQEKDHLEFILASHTTMCKVLQEKSPNRMGNQSPEDMQNLNTNACMSLHDHREHLVPPMNIDLGCMNTVRGPREQSSTVSVIQAGPSLNNSMNNMTMDENIFSGHMNSVIVGNENMMQGSYSIQAEDLRTSGQEQEHRFPATLANLDVLDHVAGETLNTPVCTLSTPSNTTSVFTFPNTPCATASSLANNCVLFPDTYSYSNSGGVMSTGNFLHPGQFNSSASTETCSQAHRRSSSSESHHSPDSVQSPKLLSL